MGGRKRKILRGRIGLDALNDIFTIQYYQRGEEGRGKVSKGVVFFFFVFVLFM